MKSIIATLKHPTAMLGALAVSYLLLFNVTPQTKAQTVKGTGFATAQEAVDAILTAAEKCDEKSLETILGPNSYDIIHTGEPVRDKEMATEFAAQVRTKQSLTKDPRNPNRLILNVGSDEWPFPLPLVKVG